MNRRTFAKCVKITKPLLNLDNVNQDLIVSESLKSDVYVRYLKHKAEMENDMVKPFTRLISANMGNPQAYGQPPLTYLRQLLAMCLHPELVNDPRFPEDVKKRAKVTMAEFPSNSLGAATDPQGIPRIRENVAHYLRERDDGVGGDPNTVFLQDGSKCIDAFFGMIADHDRINPIGILVPVPNYPIYPAVIHKYNLCMIPYYLEQQQQNWALDLKHIKQMLSSAKSYCRPKGIVIINPGNPTGHVLSKANVEDTINMCWKEDLFIFADEVYQQNILDPNTQFHSFKKIKHRMSTSFSDVELISLHSASKGFVGEGGLRGGYIEFDQVHPAVVAQFKKAISMYRCPNPAGQIALDVLVKPPDKDEPSYPLFYHEKHTILETLREKACLLVTKLNEIDGLKVTGVHGGLFVYPKIEDMPKKAIKEAEERNVSPSLLWALRLIDETGVAVAPGSTFSEKPGSYHFRIPILSKIADIEEIIDRIKAFQPTFVKAYT